MVCGKDPTSLEGIAGWASAWRGQVVPRLNEELTLPFIDYSARAHRGCVPRYQ